MLIQLKSTNPQLLDVLKKNKDSFNGLQLRQLKNGVGIGRIVDAFNYHLIFQDTKYSFDDDHSNMIGFGEFCSPRAVLSLFAIYLRDLLVEREKYSAGKIPWLNSTNREVDTEGFTHTLTIENVYADGFPAHKNFVLSAYYPEIKLEHKSGRLFKLTITTTKSIFHLVNLTALTCMYLAANNSANFYIDKELIDKYIRILHNLRPHPP